MEDEKKEKENCYMDKIKELVEKELEQISTEELNEKNLDLIDTLVDIKKDLANMDYWKVKEEVMTMRYNGYDDYSEGGYGNYGRRGVPGSGRGRYRGYDECEEMLDDMRDSYKDYYESKMAYSRGNYGAEESGMKALNDTMKTFTEFAQKMIQDVESPEAKQIIRKHLRKISDM